MSASYGSFSEQVDLFRWFHDRVILALPGGANLMDWYYNISQPLADAIRENTYLRTGFYFVFLPTGLLYLFKFSSKILEPSSCRVYTGSWLLQRQRLAVSRDL